MRANNASTATGRCRAVPSTAIIAAPACASASTSSRKGNAHWRVVQIAFDNADNGYRNERAGHTQVVYAFNTHRNRARLFRRQCHCRYNLRLISGLPGTGWQETIRPPEAAIFLSSCSSNDILLPYKYCPVENRASGLTFVFTKAPLPLPSGTAPLNGLSSIASWVRNASGRSQRCTRDGISSPISRITTNVRLKRAMPAQCPNPDVERSALPGSAPARRRARRRYK